jgi:hypothetical protein
MLMLAVVVEVEVGSSTHDGNNDQWQCVPCIGDDNKKGMIAV